ncbi:MAG: OmpA family protein [Prevotellaceae bacterium]|jgi:outer membrane protein OmpA-like peptidoglycan-associated protein/tetratricopeptide (TPR) repeat protein|nr:OmpA family protein [Prevotellaceae bacterium]
MKIVYKLIVALVLTAIAAPLAAQSIKTADKAFEQEEYFKAVAEYKALIANAKGVDKAFTLYRIGECYRRMNRPDQAIIWYAQAEENGYNRSELFYAYGDMLTILGRYEEARGYFQRYRDMRPDDDRVALKLSSIEFALAYPKSNPHFTLKPVEPLNTTGSEYGIAYMNDQLVYASTGDVTESTNKARVSMRTGLGYSKIYIADPAENSKFSRGVEMNSFNMDRSNDGTFSYDHKAKIAYYTRCEPSEDQCHIYYSELGNGSWKEKGRLKIDSKILQIAHPSITPDGKRIYFSAMIEGGYGGSDIWYIEKGSNNSWGKAINAGHEVNTAGNEVFPYVTNEVLFFSSDGRDGYGGLDIYASKITHGSHGKAVNLRPPFNTSYDDFNLIVSFNNKEGLLVSNRRNEERSDDIYSFDGYPTVILASGYVFDKETEVPLSGAKIAVRNSTSDDEEDLFETDGNGYYYSFLKPDVAYIFEVSNKGYDSQSKPLETYNITFPMEFNLSSGYDMDFYLEKEKIIRSMSGRVYEKETGLPLVNEPVFLYANGKETSVKRTNNQGVYVFEDVNPDVLYKVTAQNKDYFPESKELKIIAKEGDKTELYAKVTGYDMDIALAKIKIGEEIEIDDIYYDLDKANLLPESKVELDKFITLLKSKPGVKVQISSHTDARGSDSYNNKLSEARAKSVVDYLVANGISASQLTWKGYGETQLRIKNAKTEAEHRKNRRTTFKVLELGDAPTLDFNTFIQAEKQSDVASTLSGNGQFTARVLTAGRLDLTDPKVKLAESTLAGEKVWYQKTADGRYRYYIGRYETREQAVVAVNRLKNAGLTDCFIDTDILSGTAIQPESSVVEPAASTATSMVTQPVQQSTPGVNEQNDNVNFTVQISTANRLDMTDPKVRKAESALKEKVWHEKTSGGSYRYYIGKFRDRDQAVSAANQLKKAGITDCFVKDLKR